MSAKPQLDALMERMNWVEEKGIFTDITFQTLLLEMIAILIKEVSNLSDSLASLDKSGILVHTNEL